MKLTRTGRARVASLLWIAVAVMLLWRGLFPYFERIADPTIQVITLALALILGGAKGWFVLRRSAERTARFIHKRPERDWIWFSVHPVLYLLIPVMIAAGLYLRHVVGTTHPAIVVGVYVGVAAAMLMGAAGFRGHMRRHADTAPRAEMDKTTSVR